MKKLNVKFKLAAFAFAVTFGALTSARANQAETNSVELWADAETSAAGDMQGLNLNFVRVGFTGGGVGIRPPELSRILP